MCLLFHLCLVQPLVFARIPQPRFDSTDIEPRTLRKRTAVISDIRHTISGGAEAASFSMN